MEINLAIVIKTWEFNLGVEEVTSSFRTAAAAVAPVMPMKVSIASWLGVAMEIAVV